MQTHIHYSRETVWQSHLGVMEKVGDMDNDHLSNLAMWLAHYKLLELHAVVLKEIETRDFKPSPVQIPYHDGRGNMLVWDFQKDLPVVLRRRNLLDKLRHWAKIAWSVLCKSCPDSADYWMIDPYL